MLDSDGLMVINKDFLTCEANNINDANTETITEVSVTAKTGTRWFTSSSNMLNQIKTAHIQDTRHIFRCRFVRA